MTGRFTRMLAERDWLLADGATGTNLFPMGLMSGDAPEFWNVDHPDRIALLHRMFVDAGSDIILTNSFGGNRFRLRLHQAEHRVAELNEAAARIARQVADEAGREVIVAGSMGPTGELFEPMGTLTRDRACAAFSEQAIALARGGADVIWIETMSAEEEVEAAVTGAGHSGLPVVCTLSFDTNGRTMMGITPQALARLCPRLEPRPSACGSNCGIGAPEVVAGMLALSAADPSLVLVAKANCGIPEYVDGRIQYNGTPQVMADYARLARDAGARIIGGCCGTTPAHVQAMHQALVSHPRGPRPDPEDVARRIGPISEGARALLVGESQAAPTSRRRSRRV